MKSCLADRSRLEGRRERERGDRSVGICKGGGIRSSQGDEGLQTHTYTCKHCVAQPEDAVSKGADGPTALYHPPFLGSLDACRQRKVLQLARMLPRGELPTGIRDSNTFIHSLLEMI